MAYLTFHKWLVSVCNSHNDIWMVQTKTSHLGKVSSAVILLGWRYITLATVARFHISLVDYRATYRVSFTVSDQAFSTHIPGTYLLPWYSKFHCEGLCLNSNKQGNNLTNDSVWTITLFLWIHHGKSKLNYLSTMANKN